MSSLGWAGVCALLALASAPATYAQDEEDAAYAELMATLEQETAIVTKTRMNRDFVPGMVSVLEGEELTELGVRTVWEALAQIPGVQTELDGRGNPTLTARGIYFPFNSGSIQILLNGLPIGREDIGSNGAALLLPIAHVERLEFVRGPGSVLYGDYAFQGLLNILTRQEGRFVEVSGDNHGALGGHLLHSGQLGDWHYSASLAALDSDDVVLPGTRQASEERRSGVLQLGNGGLKLIAQGEMRDIGRISGNPPEAGYEDTSWTIGGQYDHDFSEQLSLRVHAQHLDNHLYTGEVTTPQGSAGLVFEGDEQRLGAELNWSGWARQQWLFGAEYLHGNIDLATFRVGALPGQPPNVLRVEDERRQVISAFVQDQIELREGLDLTLGARWDDNQDVGTRLTPRASLVWQPAENHVLKAQYAQGHRAPTFFELYTVRDADLDFEVNTTSELSYIHRRPGQVLRATLYDSRLDDMIYIDPRVRGFGNVASAHSRGAELEWSQRVAERIKLDATLTYTDAQDNRNAQLDTRSIAASPHWISDLAVSWRVLDRTTLGLTWNHVGERAAVTAGDGAYDRVDLSAQFSGWLHPNLDLRAGVDNVLDERTVYLLTSPNGVTQFPYQDRIGWIELRWRY
ncbi:MAG: TonB-dependent receptor [Rhodanobacteraceae bacterium]|nr:TonB-dependent receptor [Rhodanobacteraceae bacterium]